jgi:parallel beta-helix repeat protein
LRGIVSLVIGLMALIGLVSGGSIPKFVVDSMTFPFASDYINISSNADFEGYGLRGSGTAEDPYLIEGLNLSDHVGNGIVIRNTDAHLVIKDCIMQNLSGRYRYVSSQGISVEEAENVRAKDCQVSSIIFEGVENGCIENCTTDEEIYVANNPRSGSYLIRGCEAGGGLYIMGAANCLVEDCLVKDGEFGVTNSINATFRNITLQNCTFFPSGLSGASFEEIDLIGSDTLILGLNPDEFQIHLKNSTVDGRQVFYYEDRDDLELKDLNAGYIWLLNCTGARLDGVEASAIFVARSSGARIENSMIREGGQGIVLSLSKDCIISNNSIPNSSEGITVGRFDRFSSNNTLHHNLIRARGPSNDGSEVAGIRVYTESNSIGDNIITDSEIGILIAGADNTVVGNTIANNDVGIRVEENYNSITGNNFFYNAMSGVQEKNKYASESPSFVNNTWDGNFWASYSRSSSDESDENWDGIADRPYQTDIWLPSAPVDNRAMVESIPPRSDALALNETSGH